MQRRIFLKNTATLIGTIPLLKSGKLNLFSAPDEIVRIKIGKFNCTIFRDLVGTYEAKDFFMNVPQDELNKILDQYHIKPDNIPAPYTPVLIQQDNKKILIDTGIGGAENGKLHQLLGEENINSEDITDVIISHFHPDHIGGIFNEDKKPNFPNARFHMPENEWNYWQSSQSDNQPASFRDFYEKNIATLKSANLNLIKGEFMELLPGITAVKAEGHTPGHIAVIIHSEKENLLYSADTFLHPLHIEKPDWQAIYDMDHEKTRQSRIKICDMAYNEKMLVTAFHFNFPGLGRIDKSGNNWIWKYSS